jgi:hypothetical protein
MDTSEHTIDPAFLQDWYRYAANQPWAVDAYLRLVRIHEFKTREQQQKEFGASLEDFLRLQGMPLPRADALAMDALELAQDCHLQHPKAFVQTMLLAQQLTFSLQPTISIDQYYEAAFDAVEDLDSPFESAEEK